MAQPGFTPPLAALTTIFTPPCETSWLITTTKVPSQDPPFPSAGPVTCDPPAWSANLDDLGFQYYSPAICPSGFAVGPECEITDVRTTEGFPPIAEGETAVYCVPSGFTCTSDTTDFRGGVWGVAGNTNAPDDQLLVTVAPAMQIRWRDADLAFLQTHPLTPGSVLLTEPEPTGTDEPSPPVTSPPIAAIPTMTLGSTQIDRSGSTFVLILTSTAGREGTSETQRQPSSPPPATQASPVPETTSPNTIRTLMPVNTLESLNLPSPTEAPLQDSSSEVTSEVGPTWDWRTGAIAMVLSALLVTLGVVAFVCILLRRNKPNDPWSRFMRSPVGKWLRKCWNGFMASPMGLLLSALSARIANSPVGAGVKQCWHRIRPPAPAPSPTRASKKKEVDPELGVPPTPLAAELDASQRLGSPGNPAELEGFPRWNPLRWSRSSASSVSLGVVNRVKTWISTTAPSAARWTRFMYQSRGDSGDDSDRPLSVKSSRPGSAKSGIALGPPGSADWDVFSTTNSLKVPSAAHIHRAHQRNNSLASVLSAGAKNRGNAREATGIETTRITQDIGERPESECSFEMLNRLSAGTFGAGRTSQIVDEPQNIPVVPAIPDKCNKHEK